MFFLLLLCIRLNAMHARVGIMRWCGSTTTDREQRRLAETGDPKNILLSPEPSCPNPQLCGEITATKRLVRGQFVRGQLTWLGWCQCCEGQKRDMDVSFASTRRWLV